MSRETILITGADGALGRRLVCDLAERDGAELVLFLHARSHDEARAKRAAVESWLERPVAPISYAFGALDEESAFAELDPRAIHTIVHAAAVTRFNVDELTARRVNTEGTARVMAFAERCPRLARVAYLSTLYVSGLATGPFAERPCDGSAGFANHYERSKHAAEELLQRSFAHLPWQIFRVGTVVSDDASGQVSRHNAIHNTLRLLYYGLISVVPGLEATPLYLSTAELVSRALRAALTRPLEQRFFHVSHGRAEAVTLGEVVSTAFDVFEADAWFRRAQVLRPLFVDLETFEILREGMAVSGGAVRQALDSMFPFARQLFVEKQVQNQQLAALLGDVALPEPRALVRRTTEYLVRTRFGRHAHEAG